MASRSSRILFLGTQCAHPLSFNLANALQLESVPRNLIIDLIRLARNPFDMLILLVDFLTHSATELIQTLGHDVQLICSHIISLIQCMVHVACKDSPKFPSISPSIASSSSSASN
jgi:hypothetical protein